MRRGACGQVRRPAPRPPAASRPCSVRHRSCSVPLLKIDLQLDLAAVEELVVVGVPHLDLEASAARAGLALLALKREGDGRTVRIDLAALGGPEEPAPTSRLDDLHHDLTSHHLGVRTEHRGLPATSLYLDPWP